MYLSKSEIYRKHHNVLFQSHRAVQRGIQSDVQKLQSDIIAMRLELEAKRLEASQLARKYTVSNYPNSYIYLIQDIDRLVRKVITKKKRLKKELETMYE